MWEHFKQRPLGRLSTRKYINFATALLVACFVYIFATAPTTLAATDAQWKGDSISYDSQDYTGPRTSTKDGNPPLPEGTIFYTHSDTSSGVTNLKMKASVIYFATDSDPPAETSAQYVTYDFDGTNFSNPSAPKTITIAGSSTATTTSNGTSSCVLKGIGWVICPITTFLSEGMDFIFRLIDGFLEVRPLESTQDNAMYRAWSFMRNFANVAFVIAFLIIIYSQLTTFGMSNYGIKKMLPRVIVAAILVNTSYWICAVAIDVFNILGYSIQDLFILVRNSLVGTEGNSWETTSWESITSVALSGTTLAAAGIVGASIATTATAGAAGGLIFLLLPMLLAFLLVVLATFLILAARQAIITVLVILAPLAFVAYLLPNTEKWFEKWRSLFFTMLVLFPGFSVVFGGSQLAGAVIIQNANSINVILLGMAVQVAPLAITPLLLKLGGGVLNRFAGIVNNPSKGLLDRTRSWSKDRLDARRGEQMVRNREMNANGQLRRRNFARRHALGRENSKFDREKGKAANEAYSQGMWSQRRQAHGIHERMERGKLAQSVGEAAGQKHWEQLASTDPSLRQQRLTQHVDTEKGNLAKQKWENDINEWQAGRISTPYAPGSDMNKLIGDAHITAQSLAVQGIRKQAADAVKQVDIAGALETNLSLRVQAGGIDPNGAQRALASATSTIQKAHDETIANASVVLKRGNLTDSKVVDIALGMGQPGLHGHIEATEDMQEAAIQQIASSGNIGELIKMMEGMMDRQNPQHRLALVNALKSNSLRPKFVGFGAMSEITQGTQTGGQAGIDQMIKTTIDNKKVTAEALITSLDDDGIKRILQTIELHGKSHFNQDAIEFFGKEIQKVYTMDEYNGRIGERDDPLRGIAGEIGITIPDTTQE